MISSLERNGPYSSAMNANNKNEKNVWFETHAVERSSDFLACVRTVVKQAKKRHHQQQQQQHNVTSESVNGYSNDSGNQGWWDLDPASLHLHTVSHKADNSTPSSSSSSSLSDERLLDGLSILHTIDDELHHLETLVRRRGLTNDPTNEITQVVHRLQNDTQELARLLSLLVPNNIASTSQRYKHWQQVREWFTERTNKQGERLKEILKVRSNVLMEQANRRKRFQVSSSNTDPLSSSSSSSASVAKNMTGFGAASSSLSTASSSLAWDNPLFAVPSTPIKQTKPTPTPTESIPGLSHDGDGASNVDLDYNQNNEKNQATAIPKTGNGEEYIKIDQKPVAAPSVHNGGYALPYSRPEYGGVPSSNPYGNGLSGYGGYGGGMFQDSSTSVGMRQRRQASASTSTNLVDKDSTSASSDIYFQQQIQQRQQERQTYQRLAEARQAERSLAELGTMFGKMSTLISQQSEVVDKIEDDVEAAIVDVTAGQHQISILYSIKRGNRPLIIKTFALLIFLILFMRFYRR
jgi:hypothetical protein